LTGQETPGVVAMDNINSVPVSVSKEEYAKIQSLRLDYRNGKRFHMKAAGGNNDQVNPKDDADESIVAAKIGQAWFEQVDAHNELTDLEMLDEFVFEGEMSEITQEDWMLGEFEEDETWIDDITSTLTSPISY
jgi:hypothetical protein